MSNPKPAIEIVPGSFSPASFYASVVEKLKAAGYATVDVVQYPSIGRRDPEPAATMHDDAEFIRQAIEEVASNGNDVLVVAHSYGGVPASEGLKGLAKHQRQAEGKKGGVIKVLYVAALVPRLGETLGSLMGSEPASYVNIAGDYMWLEPEGSAKDNFSDLPAEDATEWAKKMPEHSAVSFGGELMYAGYKDVPVSYLYTEKDQTVRPKTQQISIDNIEQATGNKVDVQKLDSGHFPFVSRPDEVACIIRRVAGEQI